jgi:hypothetical protein
MRHRAMTMQDHNDPDKELAYPTEEQGRIPSFANREEETAFWDTPDVTEFVGQELQPVEVTIGSELVNRLTVRLDAADRVELARRAREQGIGPSTLARMWLKDRLRQEADIKTR